ncbi:hypothetical protein LEUCIP111803_00765 [Leucobacter soli]|uniref:Uncharacterized protein n=1 Tax=Leucobacter soli TaxID=2812850 RepID=A0A916NVA2_9MICO|nr:hypothetical protein LEUCIP111803_00765 [Leucobacter soli]
MSHFFAMRFPKKRVVLKISQRSDGEMIKLFEDEGFE